MPFAAPAARTVPVVAVLLLSGAGADRICGLLSWRAARVTHRQL